MGDLGSIPGLGRSPGGGHGNALQYSCLENPHGQRSLAGYSQWGHKDSDTTEQFVSHECHEISLDLVLLYGFRIPGFLCLVSTQCVGFNFKFISWSIRAAPVVASTCTFQLAKRRKGGKGTYPFKLSSKSCSYNIHLHILHHRAYFGNNNTHPQMYLGVSSSFGPNSVLPYSSFSSVTSS